jgi:hypothetical protein
MLTSRIFANECRVQTLRGSMPAKVKHKPKDDKAAYKVPSLYDSAFFLGTQYGDESAWLQQESPGEEAVSDTLPAAGDFTEEVWRPPPCFKGRMPITRMTCAACCAVDGSV